MQDFSNLGLIIALIVPLNQIVKNTLLAEDEYKFIPVISLALGIFLNLALFGIGEDIRKMILNGLIAGLSATGFFSTTKNLNPNGKFE